MPMHEIRERTVVTEPNGTEKVLLPGRITLAEAEQYGLAEPQPAPDVAAEPEKKTKTAKKA